MKYSLLDPFCENMKCSGVFSKPSITSWMRHVESATQEWKDMAPQKLPMRMSKLSVGGRGNGTEQVSRIAQHSSNFNSYSASMLVSFITLSRHCSLTKKSRSVWLGSLGPSLLHMLLRSIVGSVMSSAVSRDRSLKHDAAASSAHSAQSSFRSELLQTGS